MQNSFVAAIDFLPCADFVIASAGNAGVGAAAWGSRGGIGGCRCCVSGGARLVPKPVRRGFNQPCNWFYTRVRLPQGRNGGKNLIPRRAPLYITGISSTFIFSEKITLSCIHLNLPSMRG